MKKKLIAVSMVALLAAPQLYASEAEENYTPTRQDAGLGIGAVAGAVVGGPIGFVIGGLIGAHAGQAEDHKQQLAAKDQQLAELRTELVVARAQTGKPRVEISKDQTKVFQSFSNMNRKVSNSIATGSIATGLRIDVQFRTNSETIEQHYKPQLQKVIAVMKFFPEVDVQLSGHADPRGSQGDNLALSQRRIGSLRRLLQQAGIDDTRIHATAYGERNTISTPEDVEGHAFDRRVVLRFVNKQPQDQQAAQKNHTGFMPVGLHTSH